MVTWSPAYLRGIETVLVKMLEDAGVVSPAYLRGIETPYRTAKLSP